MSLAVNSTIDETLESALPHVASDVRDINDTQLGGTPSDVSFNGTAPGSDVASNGMASLGGTVHDSSSLDDTLLEEGSAAD